MKQRLFNAKEYFSRQEVLQELGREGQQKLRQAKVAIVGLGGLGNASALYLSMAGVGTLKLIDQDTVELNNLHRQPLYTFKDIRKPKVEAAAKRLNEINPGTKVVPVAENLRESNVDELLSDVDCVVDGLDNMATRYTVNYYCVRYKMPYVFGGAIGLEGNLSVFVHPETPCLECVLPGLDDRGLPTCETRGVLGATTGIIGTLQAVETVKTLAGMGEPLKSRLLLMDLYVGDIRIVKVNRRDDCRVCSKPQLMARTIQEKLTWLCGRETANVNPSTPMTINLRRAATRIRRRHKIHLLSASVLVFDYDGYEVSLFPKGRALIKNIQDEEGALQVYRKLVKELAG